MKPKPKSKPETGLMTLRRVGNAAAEIFSSENGKEVLKYLDRKVNRNSTFVAGDPYRTHMNEGMRVLYLHLGYLINLGLKGETTPFLVAEEPPMWEQLADINIAELTGEDY